MSRAVARAEPSAVIDLDAELVHALSEMERQDRPTGRGL